MMEQRKLAWSLASAVFGVPKELLGGPDNNLSGTGVRHLQRYFAIFHAHDHLGCYFVGVVGRVAAWLAPSDCSEPFVGVGTRRAVPVGGAFGEVGGDVAE